MRKLFGGKEDIRTSLSSVRLVLCLRKDPLAAAAVPITGSYVAAGLASGIRVFGGSLSKSCLSAAQGALGLALDLPSVSVKNVCGRPGFIADTGRVMPQ